MTTAIWNNKSITKKIKAFEKSKYLAKRPKGISDKQWQEYINEFKSDKLIMLNKAPKVKPIKVKSREDEE